MLQDCWLAEYYWDEAHGGAPTRSVGVQINGNDHLLDNVIVFDYAHVGVQVNGAANVLTTVHTWNGGGVGIEVNAYQTRLVDCYLDYNLLRIAAPSETVVEDTFFLFAGAVLAAGADGAMEDVVFRHNTFYGPPANGSVALAGAFNRSAVKNVVVADDVSGATVATRLTRTIKAPANATGGYPSLAPASVDFGDALLFPWIDYVQVTVSYYRSSHYVSYEGTRVVIEADPLGGGWEERTFIHVEVRQAMPGL